MNGSVIDRWWRKLPDGTRVPKARCEQGLRWLVKWRDARGEQHARSFARRAEADAYLASVKVDRVAGKSTDLRAGSVTLEAYVAAWLPRQVHRGEASDRASRSRLGVALDYLGTVRLRDLTRDHVQDYVAAMVAGGSMPWTVHNNHTALKAVLGDAVRSHVIPANPAVGVRLPPIPRTRVVPLTTDQLAAIQDALPANLHPLLWLGACTGMRISELVGLTWDRLRPDAVYLDRQLLPTSRAGVPTWGPLKVRGTERDVTLPPRVVDMLARHRASTPANRWGLMFTNQRGGMLRAQTATNAWNDAVKSAGLADQLRTRDGWHDLRHYHASVLISEGFSVRYVSDRLGHKNTRTTLDTYSHLMPRDEARARARLDTLAGDLLADPAPVLSLVAG